MRRREIGQRALEVCNRNRGATERTLHMIENLLVARSPAGEPVPFTAVSITAAK